MISFAIAAALTFTDLQQLPAMQAYLNSKVTLREMRQSGVYNPVNARFTCRVAQKAADARLELEGLKLQRTLSADEANLVDQRALLVKRDEAFYASECSIAAARLGPR